MTKSAPSRRSSRLAWAATRASASWPGEAPLGHQALDGDLDGAVDHHHDVQRQQRRGARA